MQLLITITLLFLLSFSFINFSEKGGTFHETSFLRSWQEDFVKENQMMPRGGPDFQSGFNLYRRLLLLQLLTGAKMSVLVVLLTFTTAVLSSPSAKKGHSTFIQTEEGYYLTGHVIDRQKASSALSCAHLCLRSRPLCRSVNYREIKGNMICELNDDGTDSAKANAPSLVPMPGYVFGQMLDLTVSKTCS